MFDPWAAWDDRVKTTGRPSRVAQQLTDPDLLNLLAAERSGRRDAEKRILKDELLARLGSARALSGAEAAHHETDPDAPQLSDPATSSHQIVMRDSMGPQGHSILPGKPEPHEWRDRV